MVFMVVCLKVDLTSKCLLLLQTKLFLPMQGRNINTINQGSLNPSNPGWVNRHTDWLQLYNYIRTANIAIENLTHGHF